MSRARAVIKTTFIYFIGNFASKLLSFFLLPLYTTYLTSEDYGSIDLLVSILPLIAPIFTMQVTESVFRFLCIKGDLKDIKRTISSSLVIFFMGILMFIVLYIPFVIKYNISYAPLFILYFFITYLGIFFQQVLRGLNRTVEYAATGVISTIVQATINIILIVKYEMGGESLLISSIVASSIITVFVAIRIKIWKLIDYKNVSKIEIKKQLKYGVPLIPNQISWWIIGLLGKYILFHFHGTRENGILAVAGKFPGLLTTINSIFFLGWTENAIREYELTDKSDFFSNGFQIFSNFIICATAGLLPIIKIYNVVIITGEFTESWKYIPIMMVGTLFNSFASFLGTIYTVSMKTKQAFTTTIVVAICNLILSLLLIPRLLIWGVVISNMISFIVFFLVRMRSVNTIVNIRYHFKGMALSSFLLIISIIGYYGLNIYGQIILLIILVAGSLVINKRIIKEMINFFKFKKI